MKKTITGLAFLGMVMVVQPSQAAFGGFRVGGMAGLGLLQGKHFYTGQPYPDADMKKRLSVISSVLGAHAGYLFELSASKLVIGAEVYLLIPGINPKIDLALLNGPQEGSVTIKHSKSIGFAVTLGMMLNPKVMAYLNVGIENARFQFTYLLNQPPIPLPAIPAKQVISHSFKALSPALGATYKMSSHFLVGIELSSPFFKRFKISASGPRGYNYKPVERRLVLKVSYLF